jgi:cell division protein FtsL
MSSAVIMWFLFVILVCELVAIIMDGQKINEKNSRIAELETENQGLKQVVFEYQTQAKHERFSKYFEEL